MPTHPNTAKQCGISLRKQAERLRCKSPIIGASMLNLDRAFCWPCTYRLMTKCIMCLHGYMSVDAYIPADKEIMQQDHVIQLPHPGLSLYYLFHTGRWPAIVTCTFCTQNTKLTASQKCKNSLNRLRDAINRCLKSYVWYVLITWLTPTAGKPSLGVSKSRQQQLKTRPVHSQAVHAVTSWRQDGSKQRQDNTNTTLPYVRMTIYTSVNGHN